MRFLKFQNFLRVSLVRREKTLPEKTQRLRSLKSLPARLA